MMKEIVPQIDAEPKPLDGSGQIFQDRLIL